MHIEGKNADYRLFNWIMVPFPLSKQVYLRIIWANLSNIEANQSSIQENQSTDLHLDWLDDN